MGLRLFKRKDKHACVIGLDGVPCTLLEWMIKAGVMPRTGEIVSKGKLTAMTVTLPEISSVSWSTFMTGKNPGEHGIFGFTDLKKGSYALRFPSFSDLRTPTIWDVLGGKGMKSVVINQPSTYPARRIPGVLVSGFVAIDLGRSVTPPMHLPYLNEAGYQIDIDTNECARDPEKLFLALDDLLAKREKALDYFWEKESWNLMEFVITGTDRLHHFMWDAWEFEDNPHHADFLAYYANVDALIGRIFDRFNSQYPDGGFFILSDHGFCRTRREVYVNTVLAEAGLLKLPSGKNNLGEIDEATRAFALDPARIYLNRKGKFPRGSVEPDEAGALVAEMKKVFEGLTVEGEKVVKYTFTNEEAYRGPLRDEGPDLVLVPHDGFDLKGKVGSSDLSGERRLQGMHTWENAFFCSLDPALLEDTGELNIVDVPRIIMRSLGVEI
jgi:predicted AlkP superfamily phosphohydrolase/phosphomutase